MKKNFKPTHEMVQAANAVFMAMAYTAVVRERVEPIQQKLLDFWKFKPVKKWEDKGVQYPEYITKWSQLYMTNDDDMRILMLEAHDEYIKLGFKDLKEPGYCPLLIAEDVERKAKRFLIDTMEPLTGLNTDKILCSQHGLENYKKMIELTLRLLAPYCDKSGQCKVNI